jgi:hypothetical protein
VAQTEDNSESRPPEGRDRNQPDPHSTRRHSLGKGKQIACWLLGVVFGGLGTYAVFTSDNQVGTGALLLFSALCILMALTGRVPQRLQFGENSVEWPEEVVDAVATAIEEGPPEIAERVAVAITESDPAGRIGQLASNRLAGITAEKFANAILNLAAAQLEEETGEHYAVYFPQPDGFTDMVLSKHTVSGEDSAIRVVVKVRRALYSRADIRGVIGSSSGRPIGKVLLILFGQLSTSARTVLPHPALSVVELSESSSLDDAVLQVKHEVREMLETDSDSA